MGEYGSVSRAGRQLSAGEMVGDLDRHATDLRRELRRRPRRLSPLGTRRPRTGEHPFDHRNQFLMRALLAAFMILAAVAVGFTGCRTSIAGHQMEPRHSLAEADALARAAGFAEEEIVAAKKVYVAKCAKCHKLYDPASYTDTEWESWMQKMG